MSQSRPEPIARHRTAISRNDLSLPCRQALADGLVDVGTSVLDYGSGRGQDTARLNDMGIDAVGWDPHFNPNAPKDPADTVLLTYVLNVIDHPDERAAVLADAWRLAKRALVVSTRLSWEHRRVQGEEWADGVVTSRNTFQKLFQPDELRHDVETATATRCVAASAGTVYAFRSETDRLALITRRVAPEFDWTGRTDALSVVSGLVGFAELRGRAPALDEIPDDQLEEIGGVTPNQIRQFIKKGADRTLVEAGARKTILNTLLILGMEVFTGRARFSELPSSIQHDIRFHFTSYKEACRRADRLLLKLRDKQYVRGAMRNSPGKLTPSALYVHRRAVESMPVVLRLYEYCGSVAVGRPAQWSVLKLHHDQDMVSWLDYPDFDADPHPRLSSSYSVELKTLKASYRSYEERANRPLLHRKQEFLSLEDPDVPKYQRLTDAEIKAGLYANPSIIGTEAGWAAELRRCGVVTRGHRLVKAKV